jgi:hypothetical protein
LSSTTWNRISATSKWNPTSVAPTRAIAEPPAAASRNVTPVPAAAWVSATP